MSVAPFAEFVDTTPLRNSQSHVYRLSQPFEGHDHVVVSRGHVDGVTLVYGADWQGEIVDWKILYAKTWTDFVTALSDIGYALV